MNGLKSSDPSVAKFPLLVRPEVNKGLISSAGEISEDQRRSKEAEQEDSGNTGSSMDHMGRDNLGLEEANGDNCVVIWIRGRRKKSKVKMKREESLK